MVSFVLLAFMSAAAGPAAPADAASAPATYHVKLLGVAPPKLAVTADVPIDGTALTMETTRPAGIHELDAGGWPALISGLTVTDASGRPIDTTSAGEAGWTLAEPHSGRLTLRYEVNYIALAARGWPAPREAASADASTFVLIGRSAFVTTGQVAASVVEFELPGGWHPVTPWDPKPGSGRAYAVASAGDLVDNLLVFSRSAPDVITVAGFRLMVVPMGAWISARGEVRRVLGAVVPHLVGLMGGEERERYLVVLLPELEHGGESYRHSFALTVETPPSRSNSVAWGNTIAHEIFHQWNGWRLRGADYAASQWFQEGFTEYAANVALVAAKLVNQDVFLRKLADHVAKSRTLTTSLEASGTHKGPPLYSAGALVAFIWDVQIRQATAGRSNVWSFMRALDRETDGGTKAYTWSDLEAALTATSPFDWGAFHRDYIEGKQPLPLDGAFIAAGCRLEMVTDGPPRVVADPTAPAVSKALLKALQTGR